MVFNPWDSGKWLPVVVKVVNWIKDKFKATSKEVGEQKPVNNESSIEDITKINEIFYDFEKNVEQDSKPLITRIEEEIQAYADELCFTIEEDEEMLKSANVSTAVFKRQIKKLKSSISGKMEYEVSRTISLNNHECRQIMKMLPGKKKIDSMRELLKSAFNNGTSAVSNHIESVIEEIYENFEVLLQNAVEQREKEIKSQVEVLKKLEEQEFEIEENKDIVDNANMVINCCDLAINTVKEVA